MNCVNHPERGGINTCSICGDWTCAECSLDIENRIVCKKCASRPRDVKAIVSKTKSGATNLFLLFIFSALPGANFMYMGFMKRGLFYMLSFFLSVYLTSIPNNTPVAFFIPIIVITCFFDGLRVRRQLLAGELVTDSIEDITHFFHRHKVAIITLGVILVGMNVLSSFKYIMFRSLKHMGAFAGGFYGLGSLGDLLSCVLTIVVIIIGISFISGGRCRKHKHHCKKTDNEDYEDIR